MANKKPDVSGKNAKEPRSQPRAQRGYRFLPPKKPQRFCPNCGYANTGNATVCEMCHQSLEGAGESGAHSAATAQAVDWKLWIGTGLIVLAFFTTGPCYLLLVTSPSDLSPSENLQASVILAVGWFLTLVIAGVAVLIWRKRGQRQ